MIRYEFHDAEGNIHSFASYREAEDFALSLGYVFVTSRSIMEGEQARIAYFLASSDVPSGVSEEKDLFPLLLAKYQEWKEPRIMPVMTVDQENELC